MDGKSSYLPISILATIGLIYGYSELFGVVYGPIVNIFDGKVQSIVSKSREGNKYYEFLGIPYAKPPVGNLRFQPPKFPNKWNGVLKADKFGPECIQAEVMVTGRIQGDEDCLYLNVYTPKIDPRKFLPVMVYIHGGLFMSGSSNMYRAKYFMENQDIVLVTFNYRLGAMGFLNTGDNLVRGNMGLKDQNMALKWVNKNIKFFGGNPNQVTIFGESAGGASVHYHMISPLSKGLFQKALSQSGTALKPWALNKNPTEQARKFASKLKCSTNSTIEMIQCLRKMDALKIVEAHLAVMTAVREPNDTFLPTIETVKSSDSFLSEDPNVLVQNGNYSKVPWLTGVNAGEGLFNLGRLVSDDKMIGRLNRDWNIIAPIMLSYDASNTKVSQEIRNYYFGPSSDLNPLISMENYTKLFSDRNFYQGLHKAALIHAKSAPVYLYFLTYKGETSLFNLFKWISPAVLWPVEVQIATNLLKDIFYEYVLQVPTQNYGPSHADELPLLFNMHYFAEIGKFSKDYEMSKSLVKLWIDFAKDNNNLKYKNTKWSPVDLSKSKILKYMELNLKGGLIDEPFTNRLKFWDSLKV